jgi:hypothetical protein
MTLQMANDDLLLVSLTARTCIDPYLDQASLSEALRSQVDEVEAADVVAAMDESVLSKMTSPSLTASHDACSHVSDGHARLH